MQDGGLLHETHKSLENWIAPTGGNPTLFEHLGREVTNQSHKQTGSLWRTAHPLIFEGIYNGLHEWFQARQVVDVQPDHDHWKCAAVTFCNLSGNVVNTVRHTQRVLDPRFDI